MGDDGGLKRSGDGSDNFRWEAGKKGTLVPMHTIYNTYTVIGMTCQHCAATISGQLSEMDGVTDVAVNLATGAVTVASTDELSDHLVETAVAHAGYQLVV